MTLEIVIAIVLLIIAIAMIFVGVVGAIVIASAFNQYWGDNHDIELHYKGSINDGVCSDSNHGTEH